MHQSLISAMLPPDILQTSFLTSECKSFAALHHSMKPHPSYFTAFSGVGKCSGRRLLLLVPKFQDIFPKQLNSHQVRMLNPDLTSSNYSVCSICTQTNPVNSLFLSINQKAVKFITCRLTNSSPNSARRVTNPV